MKVSIQKLNVIEFSELCNEMEQAAKNDFILKSTVLNGEIIDLMTPELDEILDGRN
jgi:hypothetical protein